VAHCSYNGDVYRIHESEVVEGSWEEVPGTVLAVEKDRVLVATGDNALGILAIQAPGKRALPIRDFLAGRSIRAGERFEDL
jgi:methionyl-tRNA formyltransferase